MSLELLGATDFCAATLEAGFWVVVEVGGVEVETVGATERRAAGAIVVRAGAGRGAGRAGLLPPGNAAGKSYKKF